MGMMIEFTRPDGQNAPGYLAQPPNPNGVPGVVMVEEWWGVDDRIKATADRLASHGFDVLIPDLYRGRVAAVGSEANHLVQGLDFNDAATQDLVGAARYLRERGSKKVGVMGFCVGGTLTLISITNDGDFDAASVWYSLPPPEGSDLTAIKIPLQGHWANKDDFFTPADVDALEAKLNAAQIPFEFYRYEGHHGFLNDGQPGDGGLGHYDREHAETAWRRTVEFFDRTLA